MIDLDVFEQAILFAVERHAGMVRKGTEIPYITHPMEAAAIVATMTNDKEVLAAAVLHDVVEDTPTTIEEVRQRFGDRVASLVAYESENKRTDLPASETWLIRKQETVDLLKKTTDKAEKMLVIGDKLSNIRGLCRDYERLGDAVWERFNVKDKTMHAWYYTSIVEAISDMSDTPAWQELDALVKRTFG